jgi:hypothetical protein
MNPPYFRDDRIASSTSLAIGWVSRHLDRFSPFDEHNIYCPPRTKPFIELAIMLGVHVAATGDATSPFVRNAAQLLQSVSRRPDFTHWMVRLPAEFVNYAELCAAINELGGDARELRQQLQQAVDMGVLAQIERLPHRQVELRAALDWAGIRHSLPPVEDLCVETILGQPLSAPLLSDYAIYAITHVIIFACRFGLLQGALPGWLRSATIRALLSDLIVVTSQERNWDLLGELLLCWESIGFPQNSLSVAGWESFLEVFRGDGAVPPSGAGDQQELSPDTEGLNTAESSDFDRVYHTTLVAVLAGTVFLGRSRSGASSVANAITNRRISRVSEVQLI